MQEPSNFQSKDSCKFFNALRYDPGIMSVMPWAVGCLIRKNTQWCRAFLGECRAVFVDLFHFLLLFVTFFTGRKFCKLLFTGERGKVCYFLLLFLLLVTLNNNFLLGQEGQGEGLYLLCEGGTWAGAGFRVFFFFFYC